MTFSSSVISFSNCNRPLFVNDFVLVQGVVPYHSHPFCEFLTSFAITCLIFYGIPTPNHQQETDHESSQSGGSARRHLLGFSGGGDRGQFISEWPGCVGCSRLTRLQDRKLSYELRGGTRVIPLPEEPALTVFHHSSVLLLVARWNELKNFRDSLCPVTTQDILT